MRRPFERSGPLWVPSRREMLKTAGGVIGAGLWAPKAARAAGWVLKASSAAAYVSSGAVTSAAIDTTGADLLIAFVGSENNAGNTIFQSGLDSKGNTFTPVAIVTNWGKCSMWYCANPGSKVGSGHTVSFQGNNSGVPRLVVYFVAFSGSLPTGPYDKQSTNSAVSTSIQPGALTVNAGELVVADANSSGGSPALGLSGLTLGGSIAEGLAVALTWGYAIQATTGSFNPTFTRSTSGGMAAIMAVFKAGSAGVAPVRHRVTQEGE